MRGNKRLPYIITTVVGAGEFERCANSDPMPKTFNPERPRGVDEEGNILAIQSDDVDMVMADAIYGTTLSPDEFGLYAKNRILLEPEGQDKTLFERVNDAVKRRKDRGLEPCCYDENGPRKFLV